MERDDVMFMALSTGAAIAAGIITRSLLKKGWEAGRHQPTPTNPSKEGVGWKDALAWAAISGLAGGVMRVFARRGATSAWHSAAHRKAPVE